MPKLFTQVFAPLLSLFIFMLGNGLFTTLLTLRLSLDQVSSMTIGAMTAIYYAGFFLGSFKIESLIIRVGHIRAFAAFASILAVTCMLHGIFTVPLVWLILRFITGIATAGLFIVIESWLLVMGSIKNRGQILALYMIVLYGAQALGQYLINLATPKDLLLYSVTAMLSSLAVIPLAVSAVQTPQFDLPSSLNIRQLFLTSTSGMFGALGAGLILSTIYGLLPLFIIKETNSNSEVAHFIALTIIGGMALQYPLGKLSDKIQRRTILSVITLISIITSVIIIITFSRTWISEVLLFIFGGMTFAIYPISITHACEQLDTKDITAGTQGLLLAYSMGAVLGPLVAPSFMYWLGNKGLFIYFSCVSAGLFLLFTWRRTYIAVPPQEEQFIPLAQSSPVLSEMDPRADEFNTLSSTNQNLDLTRSDKGGMI